MFQCVWYSADQTQFRRMGIYATEELAREHIPDEQAKLLAECYGDREKTQAIYDGRWAVEAVR